MAVGGEVLPAEGGLVVTTVLAGPQRIELRDAVCSTVGERAVDVPADRRGFPVEIRAGE